KRRIVVLPDPLGPISVTRSPWSTEKFSLLSTVLSPNFFCTSWNRTRGTPFCCSGCGASASEGLSVRKSLLHFPHQDRRGIAGDEEDQAGKGEGLDVGEVDSAVLPGSGHHLRDGDDDQERGVLEHR